MAKIRITGYADGSNRLSPRLTIGKVYEVLCWDIKGLGIPWIECDDGKDAWIVNSTWEFVAEPVVDAPEHSPGSLTQRIAALEDLVDCLFRRCC